MNGAGCWSTVVCTPEERARLGLANDLQWLVHCRLAVGHSGNHATDASDHPRSDRRLWLEWNDFDTQAQSLIERNPCSARSLTGAHCLFFEAHGGPHFYATGNGHAPTAIAAASGNGQAGGGPAGGRSTGTGPINTGPGAGGPGAGSAGAPSGPLPGDGYRGGRRSTNMEPPVVEGASMDGLERRRHLMPEPRAHRPAPQSGPGQQQPPPRASQTGGQPKAGGPAPHATGPAPRPPGRQAPASGSGAFPRPANTGSGPQKPRPVSPPPQPKQGKQSATGHHARRSADDAAPEAQSPMRGAGVNERAVRGGGRRRAPDADDHAPRASEVQPTSAPPEVTEPAQAAVPARTPVPAQPPVPVRSGPPALPELPATAIARAVSDAQSVVRAGAVANVEAVSKALDEVAVALAKLAAALRGRK